MALDINFLTQAYFTFDTPVPYKLKKGEITITPVDLKSSGILLTSLDIISIDKDSLPDVEVIQMSYLQFLFEKLLKDETYGELNKKKLINVLCLCLGLKKFGIYYENDRPIIYDEVLNIAITPKEFDEIRRIIMYQNIPHYDDTYINPDLKQAMEETDALRNSGKEFPSLERRIAIITAHCGLPKREQELMTYRSHSLLFSEVCGEVEFTTTRPVALFSGSKQELEHWIFKKSKDKFDGYVKSVDSYQKDIGVSKAIKSSDTSLGDSYMQQFNSF